MMAKKTKRVEYHIEILQHDIKWWVESPAVKELPESDQEHLEKMIKEGYSSGELNVTYGRHNHLETRGWWKIVNWQGIALELYHQLNNVVNADHKKAREVLYKFNESWE